MTPEIRRIVHELLSDPARLDRLVTQLISRTVGDAPAYQKIPEASLRQGSRQVMVMALGQLAEGRLPTAAELRELTAIGQLCARQGLDLGTAVAAYHRVGHELWAFLTDRARERGVAEPAVTALTKLLWEWLNAVTLAVATAHRESELFTARETEKRRSETLQALLLHPCPVTVAEQHLLSLSLDPQRRYVAFHGRLAEGTVTSDAREAIRQADPSADHALAAMGQRDVIGVLPAEADDVAAVALPASLGTFGIGGRESASRLHESYLLAGRTLNAALRLSKPGAQRLSDLRLAAAAVTDPDVTRVIADRLLLPLNARGRYGNELWHTAVTYVEHGLRVDATADALHIHVNTLRHRLAQFTTITGADLRVSEDVAEIWWLSTALTGQQVDC
ncbi:MAG TPA: helix-turn-helix domain-containing protein [Nonomuraea sp.]|nr:helix-turn-helix domain-containing protein [Nonomuraea sp.]